MQCRSFSTQWRSQYGNNLQPGWHQLCLSRCYSLQNTPLFSCQELLHVRRSWLSSLTSKEAGEELGRFTPNIKALKPSFEELREKFFSDLIEFEYIIRSTTNRILFLSVFKDELKHHKIMRQTDLARVEGLCREFNYLKIFWESSARAKTSHPTSVQVASRSMTWSTLSHLMLRHLNLPNSCHSNQVLEGLTRRHTNSKVFGPARKFRPADKDDDLMSQSFLTEQILFPTWQLERKSSR